MKKRERQKIDDALYEKRRNLVKNITKLHQPHILDREQKKREEKKRKQEEQKKKKEEEEKKKKKEAEEKLAGEKGKGASKFKLMKKVKFGLKQMKTKIESGLSKLKSLKTLTDMVKKNPTLKKSFTRQLGIVAQQSMSKKAISLKK